MKFSIHLFTQVRVKVTGVIAESFAEAMAKAERAVNFHDLLDNTSPRTTVSGGMQVEAVEWGEDAADCACVDPLLANGDVDYDRTLWLGPDGEPLVDGKTTEERKAAGFDRAKRFMDELLDSVETLTGIAEVYGARTLADLMYLHGAILSGGHIDYSKGGSQIPGIVGLLPSGAEWLAFISSEAAPDTAEYVRVDYKQVDKSGKHFGKMQSVQISLRDIEAKAETIENGLAAAFVSATKLDAKHIIAFSFVYPGKCATIGDKSGDPKRRTVTRSEAEWIAAGAAACSFLPQTVYKEKNGSGWKHTIARAPSLAQAKMYVVVPAKFKFSP